MADLLYPQLKEVEDWIFTQGCVKGFGEWLSNHELVILLTACVVMFMQVRTSLLITSFLLKNVITDIENGCNLI